MSSKWALAVLYLKALNLILNPSFNILNQTSEQLDISEILSGSIEVSPCQVFT